MPLQTFEVKINPAGKLLRKDKILRSIRNQERSNNFQSTNDIWNDSEDVSNRMHVMDSIRSNSAVLAGMKGYPKKPLGFKVSLNQWSHPI